MQIKIHLNKEKIFFQQNDLELNEFINEFYNEFLSLKETFESQINQKNEEIKKIKEENKEIQFKLEEMKKDNKKLSNKLKEIKENITEKSEKSPKDNSSKKNINFEPKKEEIISQPDQNQIDLTGEYQYPHNPYMNNNQYYYYLPHYYNNSGYWGGFPLQHSLSMILSRSFYRTHDCREQPIHADNSQRPNPKMDGSDSSGHLNIQCRQQG